MKKKLTSLILALLMLCTLLPVTALAAGPPPADSENIRTEAMSLKELPTDPSEENTYLIDNEEELRLFSQLVNSGASYENKTIKLTNSFTLTGGNFTPIGTRHAPFMGTFDGQAHTLTGLTVDTAGPAGLFGYISSSGAVKNLNLANVSVSSSASYAGGIVAFAEISVIERCSVTGYVHGLASSGGILGYIYCYDDLYCNDTHKITDCEFSGLSYSELYAGGIVGYSYSHYFEVTRCVTRGSVISETYANGISSFVDKSENCVSRLNAVVGHIYALRVSYYAYEETNCYGANDMFLWANYSERTPGSDAFGLDDDSDGTDGTDIDPDGDVFEFWAGMGYTTENGWTLPTNESKGFPNRQEYHPPQIKFSVNASEDVEVYANGLLLGSGGGSYEAPWGSAITFKSPNGHKVADVTASGEAVSISNCGVLMGSGASFNVVFAPVPDTHIWVYGDHYLISDSIKTLDEFEEKFSSFELFTADENVIDSKNTPLSGNYPGAWLHNLGDNYDPLYIDHLDLGDGLILNERGDSLTLEGKGDTSLSVGHVYFKGGTSASLELRALTLRTGSVMTGDELRLKNSSSITADSVMVIDDLEIYDSSSMTANSVVVLDDLEIYDSSSMTANSVAVSETLTLYSSSMTAKSLTRPRQEGYSLYLRENSILDVGLYTSLNILEDETIKVEAGSVFRADTFNVSTTSLEISGRLLVNGDLSTDGALGVLGSEGVVDVKGNISAQGGINMSGGAILNSRSCSPRPVHSGVTTFSEPPPTVGYYRTTVTGLIPHAEAQFVVNGCNVTARADENGCIAVWLPQTGGEVVKASYNSVETHEATANISADGNTLDFNLNVNMAALSARVPSSLSDGQTLTVDGIKLDGTDYVFVTESEHLSCTVVDGLGRTSTLSQTNGVYSLENMAVGEYYVDLAYSKETSTAFASYKLTVTEAPPIYIAVHTIKADAGIGGSISPSGAVSVIEGSSKEFVITPKSGFVVSDVLVDGESVGAVTDYYKFERVTAGHTIEAKFRPDYSDVSEDDWFCPAVSFVTDRSIMNGVSQGRFAPHEELTRAMLAVMLWRLDGESAPAGENPFTDLEQDWYKTAVIWAAENGLVQGYGGGLFRPEDFITREQMAVMLYRYAILKGYDVSVGEDTNILSFNDAEDLSEYAVSAMQWACGAGLVQGNGNYLRPGDPASRAEVATIITRFMEKIVPKE